MIKFFQHKSSYVPFEIVEQLKLIAGLQALDSTIELMENEPYKIADNIFHLHITGKEGNTIFSSIDLTADYHSFNVFLSPVKLKDNQTEFEIKFVERQLFNAKKFGFKKLIYDPAFPLADFKGVQRAYFIPDGIDNIAFKVEKGQILGVHKPQTFGNLIEVNNFHNSDESALKGHFQQVALINLEDGSQSQNSLQEYLAFKM